MAVGNWGGLIAPLPVGLALHWGSSPRGRGERVPQSRGLVAAGRAGGRVTVGDSWGWGGLSARRGLGLQTREGGGLETHRVAAKMSGEVHGEGWQLLVPLAAPPPLYIFMSAHERAAPNGSAARPAVAIDCTASCRHRSSGRGCNPRAQRSAWNCSPAPGIPHSTPCQELTQPRGFTL